MRTLLLSLLSLWLFTPVFSQYQQLGQQIDGNAPNDSYGFDVAIDKSGKIMAVGGPLYDNDFGQVRVYRETNGTWTQVGNDINGDEIGMQVGFSVALNANGRRLAIGGISGASTQGGFVDVYDLLGNTWFRVGNRVLAEATGDQLGVSLAMNDLGDRFVVGARNNNGGGTDAGQARVYQLMSAATNSWVLVGSDIDGLAAGDAFGSSVSMDSTGTRIAVGAPEALGQRGQVRVFQEQAGMWTLVGSPIDGQNAGEEWGSDISLNADGLNLVSTAPLHDHGPGFGTVRAYMFSGGSWNSNGPPMQGNSRTEAYGETVSMNAKGDLIAVGTSSNDDNAMSSGKVDVYKLTAGVWFLLNPTPLRGATQFESLGHAVALNGAGNRVAVGARLANGTQGYARVYEDSQNPVSLQPGLPTLNLSYMQQSDHIRLKTDQVLTQATAHWVDMQGKTLLQQSLQATSVMQLPLPPAAGVYVLRVVSQEGVWQRKVWRE